MASLQGALGERAGPRAGGARGARPRRRGRAPPELPSPPRSLRRRREANFPGESTPPPAPQASAAGSSLENPGKQRHFRVDRPPGRRRKLPDVDGGSPERDGSFPSATEASRARRKLPGFRRAPHFAAGSLRTAHCTRSSSARAAVSDGGSTRPAADPCSSRGAGGRSLALDPRRAGLSGLQDAPFEPPESQPRAISSERRSEPPVGSVPIRV